MAITYDATADFTSATTTNPNGVWSYGYDSAGDSGAYNFRPFDLYSVSGSDFIWQKAGYISFGTPSFYRSLTGHSYGVAPGQIVLHPGPAASFSNDDAAILRFTAPVSGQFDVSAQFFGGDTGLTVAWIVKNGNLASPLASLGSTNSNPTFSMAAIALTGGDTLDFAVGNAGSYFSDTTPLTAVITSAVPEPLPLALWACGLGLLACARRRKVG